tara:strand:+ start:45 stop:353 length:309 start_codon:yes stop_codon:yes gene_type:complete
MKKMILIYSVVTLITTSLIDIFWGEIGIFLYELYYAVNVPMEFQTWDMLCGYFKDISLLLKTISLASSFILGALVASELKHKKKKVEPENQANSETHFARSE